MAAKSEKSNATKTARLNRMKYHKLEVGEWKNKGDIRLYDTFMVIMLGDEDKTINTRPNGEGIKFGCEGRHHTENDFPKCQIYRKSEE